MKKIFFSILISLPVALLAQVKIDRTKAPLPAAAPVIKIGEPSSFTLANGLKVIVVQNTKLPRVTATLTIDRDGILEGDKAGMEGMAGQLLRRGTTTLKKADLDEAIDYLGAEVDVTSASVSGSSLTTNFNKVMAIMADIALHPSFPADELEKIRTQELSNLAQGKEEPESIASNVVSKLAYGKGHPYGEVETETTAKNVTVDDIKSYYTTYWKPNIAYLIFVGDITPEHAKKLAEDNFGQWQKGTVPDPTYPVPQPASKTFIAVVDRPASVQSVIKLVTPLQLKPGADDAIAARVMANVLGGGASSRLFGNLREKYGFTYGAYGRITADKMVGNFTANASVRNEKTDSSIGQFLYEFNRIRTEPVSDNEVALSKNTISGSFARSLEDPETVATFALNIARYKLPADYYQNYLKNVAAVGPDKVKEMADKYVLPNNLYIVIIGNAKEIVKGLDKYGEVKYFDVYGNEMGAPTAAKTVDTSITAESIFKKSIEADGGNAAISAVKDVEIKGTASVMGQVLDFNSRYVAPGAFVSSINMKGMTIMKQMAKGGTYAVSQQGNDKPLKDEDKEELNEQAAIVSEVYILSQPGYHFTVKGIEPVDGKDAYAVEIKSPKGRVFTYYYDVNTSLKVKETKTQDAGPAGKVTIQTYYTEYKPYNGVQIPVKFLVDQGQFKINMEVTDVKINQGLRLDDIK